MISKRKAATAAKAAALMGLSLTLPACATIVRGSTQEVTFQSTPPNAKVATTNGFRCDFTPCTIRMPRNERFKAKVTLEGYESAETFVTNRQPFKAVLLSATGNVLVTGGIVGAMIDIFTGATWELTPNPVSVELKPIEAEPSQTAEAPSAPVN